MSRALRAWASVMSVRSGTEVVSGPPETLYEMVVPFSTSLPAAVLCSKTWPSSASLASSEALPFRPTLASAASAWSLVRPRSCGTSTFSEGLGPLEITRFTLVPLAFLVLPLGVCSATFPSSTSSL